MANDKSDGRQSDGRTNPLISLALPLSEPLIAHQPVGQADAPCPLCGGDWWSCRCRAAVAPVRCDGRRDGPAGGHPGFRRAGGQNALACVVYPSARIFCSKTRKRPDRDRGLVGGAERETGRAGSRARA